MTVPRSFPTKRLTALLAIAPLTLAAACAGDDALTTNEGDNDKGGVVLGGQNFTEMQVMSEIYKQLLEAGGYDVTLKLVESRDVYVPEMQKGNIDLSPDYLSSMTEYLNAQANGPDAAQVASNDPEATVAELKKLSEPTGIEPLEPSKAQDANAFAVTQEYAEDNDLSTLSDLAALGEPVTLAAAEDCSQRDDCEIGLEKTYGLKITKVEPLGFGTQGTKDALKKGEVTLGQVGTTDATLDSLGLVLLEDDKQLQNAENLVPMVNTDFIDANPEVRNLLNNMSAGLTTDDLSIMIGQVDEERMLPADVASEYLVQKSLIEAD